VSLRIHLENFRCHTNSTFTFPASGLIQLSGESGRGKSTVLTGICYALYGKINGKIKKPYTHGKTTSKVTLEFDGLKIVRTAKPSRVVVYTEDGKYENDAAEGVIEKMIGMSYEEFLASSYIIQNQDMSVLSMTSMDQVRFVEQLAFHDDTHIRLKEKIKVTSKEIEIDIHKQRAQLEMFVEKLDEVGRKYPTPVETPDVIKKGLTIPVLRKEIATLGDKTRDAHMNVTNASKKLSELRERSSKYNDSLNVLTKLGAEIELLTSRRNTLKNTVDSKNLEELKIQKINLKKLFNIVVAEDELEKEKTRYNELQREHTSELEKKRAELLSTILPKEMVSKLQNDITSYVSDIEAKKELIQKIDRRREALKRILQIRSEMNLVHDDTRDILNDVYDQLGKMGVIRVPTHLKNDCLKCPSCDTSILATSDSVHAVVFDDEGCDGEMDRYNLLKGYARELEECIGVLAVSADGSTTVENLKSDISVLEEKKMIAHRKIFRSDTAAEELAKLELVRSNNLLETMNTRIQTKLKTIVALRQEMGAVKLTKMTADEITTTLEGISVQISSASDTIVALEECDASLVQKTKELNVHKTTCAAYANISAEIATAEKELMAVSRVYNDINSSLESKRALLESLSEYEIYLGVVDEISQLKDNIATRTKAITALEERSVAMNTISSVVKEAEILAIVKTVEAINTHAKEYLDRMYDDPISIRLEGEKELKDGKIRVQLNTTIDYKGHKYDSIDELSGGEKQRAELAFLLAINDMLGSKILMLDECLNNLDSNVNTEVLTYLRELSGGKLMLVISHEAVKGVFDSEVAI
jgi:DNA repair exonuclease SbcCD ATPase subunit